ncbi:hypothetical protein L226DRAFT_521754 [Lentinus tigrinus ALCF2SS1-7]|uniref:uncharacterized protein n=1 Tax=Lentinus tigrinus ALCF2SS1-7 TaxID=1328758 RepID=UPI001165C87D|nr:hypothetical protein L226DRAFT_521754 [Lentinus tigrinus ALCF2SS1-7]
MPSYDIYPHPGVLFPARSSPAHPVMSMINDLITHLYFLSDTAARRNRDATNMTTLVLFVNRSVSTAMFFLPTSSDLNEDSAAAATKIDVYLADIHGGVLMCCNVNDEQGAVVLQLLLAYQAFYTGIPSLDVDAYLLMTTMLVEARDLY